MQRLNEPFNPGHTEGAAERQGASVARGRGQGAFGAPLTRNVEKNHDRLVTFLTSQMDSKDFQILRYLYASRLDLATVLKITMELLRPAFSSSSPDEFQGFSNPSIFICTTPRPCNSVKNRDGTQATTVLILTVRWMPRICEKIRCIYLPRLGLPIVSKIAIEPQ